MCTQLIWIFDQQQGVLKNHKYYNEKNNVNKIHRFQVCKHLIDPVWKMETLKQFNNSLSE